jgi:hypothetical protein
MEQQALDMIAKCVEAVVLNCRVSIFVAQHFTDVRAGLAMRRGTIAAAGKQRLCKGRFLKQTERDFRTVTEDKRMMDTIELEMLTGRVFGGKRPGDCRCGDVWGGGGVVSMDGGEQTSLRHRELNRCN